MRTREQADQAADQAREELLATLGELERRRRRATDWRLQLHLHRTGVLLALGAAVLGVGLAIAWRGSGSAGRRRARRLAAARRTCATACRRVTRRGERATEAPWWREPLQKVLVAFGVALATQAGRRAAAALVSGVPERSKDELYVH